MAKVSKNPISSYSQHQATYKIGNLWAGLTLEEIILIENGKFVKKSYRLESEKGQLKEKENWKEFFSKCSYEESMDFLETNFINQKYSSIKKVDKKVENLDNIFVYNRSSQMIFDLSGEPITRPYKFDYIGTPFSSATIDIKKAHERLKKHPWCREISEIKMIPYYNQPTGEKYRKDPAVTFDITLTPDQKTYSKLWKKFCEDPKVTYPSVSLKEAIHDGYKPTNNNNLLGLLDLVI